MSKDIRVSEELEKAHCSENPEVQSSEHHDCTVDGVTYRVWSAFLGRISNERYEQMTQSYESEQESLRRSVPDTRAEIAALKAKTDVADRFIKVIDKFTDIKELNAELLNELIERIVVHHKEKVNGRTYQQVEIYYRLVGELGKTAEKAA